MIDVEPRNMTQDFLMEFQRRVVEAHTAYQKAMTESHVAFLKTAEFVFSYLGIGQKISANSELSGHSVSGMMLTTPQAAMSPAPTLSASPVPRISAVPSISSIPPVSSAPMVNTFSTPTAAVSNPTISPTTVPSSVSSQSTTTTTSTKEGSPMSHDPSWIAKQVIDIIAEKTGYPAEMLNLDMELEADLGIDSIKKVEILSASQQAIPNLPEPDIAVMANLKTLGQITQYFAERLGVQAQ